MTDTDPDASAVLIERWFPVAAVDEACGNPAGSGKNEKAIFTWFASRPIAQARAAVACALLGDDPATRETIDDAVRGDRAAVEKLAVAISARYPTGRPVVLDTFSGRGIIPLEAARLGAVAVGLDLSPVATLAGRILADYPLRDWSHESPVPWQAASVTDEPLPIDTGQSRLVADLRLLLAEVGRRVRESVDPYYPKNPDGSYPWGYLWAISIPCDNCHRRFPLVGSMVLRHPYIKTGDAGQSLRLAVEGDTWSARVEEGPAQQAATYSSTELGDGKRRKGKSARCLFCQHIHSLEAVKAKGFAGEYVDEMLVAADTEGETKKVFRELRPSERAAASQLDLGDLEPFGPYSAVPDEMIPEGNVHTVMASGYGYRTFGTLMCDRQTLQFVKTAQAIRACHSEALVAGTSEEYAKALASTAAAFLVRRIRRATRGCKILAHGNASGAAQNRVQAGDLFSSEASILFQLDYLETGPGDGPGTWASVCATGLTPFETHVESLRGIPGRFRQASSMALPYRDGSIDAVVTDPPYYDMIEYADASDLFHVWLKRILFDIEPDLFGPSLGASDGLQNKNDEIIVRRVHEPGRVRHDKDFYESSLSKAFAECRRVLRPDGHLVVVFGHSDPDAWKRLLGALQDAGFVVTSSWPSRTESANTGVASIKVTVTIGCRVAPTDRRSTTAAQVEREISELIRGRVQQWDEWGLALSDQLMASYGPAMHVVGRYRSVQRPDGSDPDLDHFLTVGRRAVIDAHAFKVDEIPLDTFDAQTRFAIFWLRAFGRGVVNKGEAVFHAQSSQMRIDDLRPSVLAEVKGGFALTLEAPPTISDRSSVIHIVRALAAEWPEGGTEAAASVIATAGLSSDDSHLWATVAEFVRQLPESDKIAMALSACQRNRRPIESATRQALPAHVGEQLRLDTSGDI